MNFHGDTMGPRFPLGPHETSTALAFNYFYGCPMERPWCFHDTISALMELTWKLRGTLRVSTGLAWNSR